MDTTLINTNQDTPDTISFRYGFLLQMKRGRVRLEEGRRTDDQGRGVERKDDWEMEDRDNWGGKSII